MTRSEFSILLLFAALFSLGAPRLAHAAQSYDNCAGFVTAIPAVITTPGTWCLKQDLATNMSSGNAIEIQTNNVTIDCNHFKLGGLAAGMGTQAIGIYSLDRLHVTIRHCNIRGFYRGIRLTGPNSGRHLVEDNRFDGNTYIGLSVTGIGSVVRRNMIFNSGGSTVTAGAYGIFAGAFVDVLDNTVSGVGASSGGDDAIGIFASGNVGSIFSSSISGNRIRGLHANTATSYSFGIQVVNDARAVVRDNSVVGNASANSTGVYCDGFSPNNSVRQNVLNGFAVGNSGCNDDGGNVIAP